MSMFFKKIKPELIKQIFVNLFLISLGSIICASAVNGILIPHRFFGAGFTGAALIIHYLIPSYSVAGIYFILNIPIFALGWMYVGRRFFIYSILGAVIFTAALKWTYIAIPVNDKILCALLAGIIMGTGSGIILRSLGSAGGLDVLCVIFLKRFSIRLGTTVLAFNVIILLSGAFLFSLEAALFTLIYIYVNSHIMNLVVMGLSQRKAIFIISPQWEEISRGITEKIQRGVTVIDAKGGYSGQDLRILYSVIALQELSRLKELVRTIDPGGFVVVTDTLEVMGTRIGNQPHW
jgi:uncharacterized membrane-anchored protein YitT (DUF2179 family)